MFDVLASLDTEQRAVATSDASRLRVLAGAGTGKTTAITGRVAHLVNSGTLPDRVLLLTFTRRAAHQMITRTASLLESARSDHARKPGRIVAGTFHSIAHRTLRQHASRIGLSEGFAVLDPSDAADLMDVVRDDVIGDRAMRQRFPRKATLLELYSRAVDTETPLSTVVTEVAPWCIGQVDDIASIASAFVARKRRMNLLDFDDLLLHWREALRDDRVGPLLANSYDHVLVDEYQDVNALQVEVLRRLTRGDQQLAVVGDDAQAIYSFRASTPRHILEFDRDFPDAVTLPLTTNYRSTAGILGVANAVGSEALVGFSTVLRPAPRAANGAVARAWVAPRLVRCDDEDAQSDAACKRILELREFGVALREQAVLIRAAHHSDHLELELTRRGIPFVKYGGLRYLEAAHVKDLLAAFRLADNPRDELSWFRLLQLLDGVGPATARRAVGQLGIGDVNESDTNEDAEIFLRWPLASSVLPKSVRPMADALVASLHSITGESPVVHADRLRLAVTPLIQANYSNAEARVVDLQALVDASSNVARLSEVAAEHALAPPRSTGELAGPPSVDEDWLVISTVHSAKGLEWDAVHVLHAADGNFPSDMALTSTDGLEEERRLFYVALTRPRQYLDIYVPLRYHHQRYARNDRHSWAQPSRFLSESVQARCEPIAHCAPVATSVIELPVGDATAAVDAALNSLWR